MRRLLQSITGAKEQTCAWLYYIAVTSATQLGTDDMIYFDFNRIWDTHNRANLYKAISSIDTMEVEIMGASFLISGLYSRVF